MSNIQVNPTAAHRQATKICQASDKLSISKTVTFSSKTTILGNTDANSTFQNLKKGIVMAQQVLNRDVESIQSVITTFTRTDERIKKSLVDSLLSPELSGGGIR